MASIRRRRPGSYQVTVRMRNGKRLSLGGFPTKALARSWAMTAESAIHDDRPDLVYASLPLARQADIAARLILECARCADQLRDRMARNGCLVQISTDRSDLTGPYICRPYRCTHGTTYWVTPTEEQGALWRATRKSEAEQR